MILKTLRSKILLSLIILLLLAGACRSEPPQELIDAAIADALPESDLDPVIIYHEIWDGNQLLAYEDCANRFTSLHPHITINLYQTSWGEYWPVLREGMASDFAPDVFANHLTQVLSFAKAGQLLDLQPFVERDGVDTSIYLDGLEEMWIFPEGRFGLPKDWDSVAVVYNKRMVEEARLDPALFDSWTWNPKDGGSFEEAIRQLTMDSNGRYANDPDFDANQVNQYGLIPFTYGAGGAFGQTEWSHFAVSNGFTFVNENDQFQYDDLRFIETITWLRDLSLEKRLAAPYEEVVSRGAAVSFIEEQGAMIIDGSWMVNWYANVADFELGFAPLPIGPEGRRSMLNSVADSIWAGTPYPEEAWLWVQYVASPDCAEIVGHHSVVFPAQAVGMQTAQAAFSAKGIDISPFTLVRNDENSTFGFPVSSKNEILDATIGTVMDQIFLGAVAPSEGLQEANQHINNLEN